MPGPHLGKTTHVIIVRDPSHGAQEGADGVLTVRHRSWLTR